MHQAIRCVGLVTYKSGKVVTGKHNTHVLVITIYNRAVHSSCEKDLGHKREKQAICRPFQLTSKPQIIGMVVQ